MEKIDRSELMRLRVRQAGIGDEIHNEKKRIISEHCPYKLEQVIEIPENAWSHVGKEGAITNITLDDRTATRLPWQWRIHGHVLNKNGHKSKGTFKFLEEVMEELP